MNDLNYSVSLASTSRTPLSDLLCSVSLNSKDINISCYNYEIRDKILPSKYTRELTSILLKGLRFR